MSAGQVRTAAAVTCAVFSAIASIGPLARDMIGPVRPSWCPIWVRRSAGFPPQSACILGSSGKTSATGATEAAKRLSLNQIASIAGFLLAMCLAVGLSLLDAQLSGVVQHRCHSFRGG